MDLGTGHMAYTTHIHDARRAEQERERLRAIRERAAGRTDGLLAAPAGRRVRGIPSLPQLFAQLIAPLRTRRPAAQ